MTYNELYDFCNLNTGLVNATNAITSATHSLKNCFPSDSPIAKDAVNINVSTLYPEHRVIERSKAAFYGVPEIKKVIFNYPATIILWEDGTKTVVKAQDKDQFDKEKGLAMAIVKKTMANNHSYYNEIFKKWLPKEEPVETLGDLFANKNKGCEFKLNRQQPRNSLDLSEYFPKGRKGTDGYPTEKE